MRHAEILSVLKKALEEEKSLLASPSYFCAACGDTERVKKSSGRRKVTTSSSRNVYSLLESIIGNKISERNLQVDVPQLMEAFFQFCIS